MTDLGLVCRMCANSSCVCVCVCLCRRLNNKPFTIHHLVWQIDHHALACNGSQHISITNHLVRLILIISGQFNIQPGSWRVKLAQLNGCSEAWSIRLSRWINELDHWEPISPLPKSEPIIHYKLFITLSLKVIKLRKHFSSRFFLFHEKHFLWFRRKRSRKVTENWDNSQIKWFLS